MLNKDASNDGQEQKPTSNSLASKRSQGRSFLVTLIWGMLFIYVLGEIIGAIPSTNRLDAISIILIVIGIVVSAFILNPGMIDRVSKFVVSPDRIEFELIKKRQEDQEEKITILESLVVDLISQEGLEVLKALDNQRAPTFLVTPELHDGIRQIRSMGLVVKKSGKNVKDMTIGSQVNIFEWVKLGEGRRTRTIIDQIAKVKSEKEQEENVL